MYYVYNILCFHFFTFLLFLVFYYSSFNAGVGDNSLIIIKINIIQQQQLHIYDIVKGLKNEECVVIVVFVCLSETGPDTGALVDKQILGSVLIIPEFK